MTERATPITVRAAIPVAIAMAAGVLGAIQPKINAVLATRVGAALLAALVNFGAAFGVVIVVLLLKPRTRRNLRELPSWPVPRWTLTAGLGGAVMVVAGALAVQTIGVAVFSVAFFAGQIIFGILVDRMGVGPGGVRPVNAPRVQAAALAVAAVVASQIGRPIGEFAPELVLLVVAGGAAFAFQSAFNGRIAEATGDAAAATAVNVTVGIAALAAIVAASVASGVIDAPRWPAQPLLYTGGVLGVTIVLSLAVATRAVGVLRATVAMLAAQLIVAFVIDWVSESEAPTPGAIVGGVLIVAAVGLLQRQPRRKPEPTGRPGRELPR